MSPPLSNPLPATAQAGQRRENIYGHVRRLQWIKDHVRPDELLIEFGCGTGYMISLPLTQQGYRIIGLDLDAPSIAYGQEVCRTEGVDPSILRSLNIADLEETPDVVIASEVLEHIPDAELGAVLDLIRRRLPTHGRLLVTVPNGYGWFELESFLWFKAGIGSLMRKLWIVWMVDLIKGRLFGPVDYPHPSTIAHSPHVQRFTLRSIRRLLETHGFEVTDATGSALFAGPFSNLFFTNVGPIMALNNFLGRLLPPLASGFYVACRKRC